MWPVDGIPDNPDAIKALQAFTSLRANQFDSFMSSPNLVDDPATPDVDESKITQIDAFVAPDYGTVMPYVTSALRPPGTPADPYAGGTARLMGRFEGNIMGLPALAGNRDGLPPYAGFAGRAKRAHLNMLENLVLFSALVLIAAVAQKTNPTTALDKALLPSPDPCVAVAIAPATVICDKDAKLCSANPSRCRNDDSSP